MARKGINHSICIKCRNDLKPSGRVPPCEKDNVCYLTGLDVEDDRAPMLLDPIGKFIAKSYDEITSMSVRERIDRVEKRGDNTVKKWMYYPTLDKLELWMSLNSWETSPVCKEDFFFYIRIYHNSYVSGLSWQ